MKKIISLIALLVILSSFFVIASDEIAEDTKEMLGAIGKGNQKLSSILPFSTVIDGYICSESADWNYRTANNGEFYIKQTDNPFCHTNTKHNAEVWIVWTPDPVWKEIADPRLSYNEKYCIEGLPIGTRLDYSYYYCDDKVDTCEPGEYYPAGCDYDKCDEGYVLMRRDLHELTSGGCNDYVSEKCWVDSDFGFDCQEADGSNDANSGDDGSDGTPDPNVLRGEWQNIGIPPQVAPGEQFEIKAKFVALEDGKYYLEAGLLPTRYSITAEGSQCDGDIHFAGVYQELKKDESVDIKFKVMAYKEEGTYSAVIGAYTGCINDGGKKVNTLSQAVKVGISGGGDTSIKPFVLSGLGIGAIFLIIVILIGILLLWYFNK